MQILESLELNAESALSHCSRSLLQKDPPWSYIQLWKKGGFQLSDNAFESKDETWDNPHQPNRPVQLEDCNSWAI